MRIEERGLSRLLLPVRPGAEQANQPLYQRGGRAGPRPPYRRSVQQNPRLSKQQRKSLDLLLESPNRWVGLAAVLQLQVAQYNSRIHELRLKGWKIENRTAWVNDKKHSWFRIVAPTEREAA